MIRVPMLILDKLRVNFFSDLFRLLPNNASKPRKRKYHIVKYKGQGNRLLVHFEDGKVLVNPKFVADIRVKFEGNNSLIEVFEPYSLDGSRFALRNNDHFVIKKSRGNISVIGGESAKLFIDENCTLQNTKIFMNDEKGVSVKIGKDCMFSYDIAIWASDTHQILDNKSNEIINFSSSGIEIGNHVWCGTRCVILKDVKISDNTVVGAGSIVTSKFDRGNIIIAGNPAHIIKNNIIWKREGLTNV